MTAPLPRRVRVAIIGGGFTGAAVAYHLAGATTEADIAVFEPRDRLGAGLAYGTRDPVHRINVPATRMTLVPAEETHFADWLAASGVLEGDDVARLPSGEVYPRRAAFGAYVAAQLAPLLKSGRVRHYREHVVDVAARGGGWTVRTAEGVVLDADLVVVATSHPEPRLPAVLEARARDPRIVADALVDGALDAILPDDRVLIVGSGLTAADVVASLDARGHTGTITQISRRGQRPRGQAPIASDPHGDFTLLPARTARTLVARIRAAIAEVEAEGRSWHPVLDAVRAQGDAVWNALVTVEQRRLLRHLRPFWDAHRFRIAPQIDAVLDRRFAEGSLELLAASLRKVVGTADGFHVTWRVRRTGALVERVFDRIVVTTGPSHRDILTTQPYLAGLAQTGHVAFDPAGLGLHTSRQGRALGSDGEIRPSLFIAGPLARGTFGELMGLPQVSHYARLIADQLTAAVAERVRAAPVSQQSP